MRGVYILHFEYEVQGFSSDRFTDQCHYVGQTTDLESRIKAHRYGKGSAFTQAAKHQDNPFIVSYFVEVAGQLMRKENWVRKRVPQLCPICIDPVNGVPRMTSDLQTAGLRR